MKIYEYEQKNYPYLETYDAGAMFIGSYVLKLFLQVALVILLAVTAVPDTFTSTMGGICLITTLNELAFFLTPIAYGKIRGRNLLFDMGFEKKFSPWIALILLPLTAAVICFGSPLASGFIKIVEAIGYKTENVTSIVVDSGADLALTTVFVALIPAVAEEYLFRGCIARGLSKNGYFFAITVSSALFALMHGNPLQLVHQFILGVACAVLYFSTRSLWPSILLHFLNNETALVLGYLESLGKPLNLSVGAAVGVCIAGVVATCALLFAVVLAAMDYLRKHPKKVALSEDAAQAYATKKYAIPALQKEFFELHKSEEELFADNSAAEERRAKLADAVTDAEQLVVRTDMDAETKKRDMKDKKALIYSFILTVAVWVISFIVNVV